MIASFLFYVLASSAFLIDIFCFSIFDKQSMYALLSLFIIQTFQPLALIRVSCLIFLVSVESFFFYGKFWLPFLYSIPAIFLGIKIRQSCYSTTLYHYALLLFCIFTQYFIIEQYLLGLPGATTYTFSKVFVTLFLLTVLSKTSTNTIEIIR